MDRVSIGRWLIYHVPECLHKDRYKKIYMCVLVKLDLSIWRLFLKQEVGCKINIPNVSEKRRLPSVFNST